MYIIFKQKAFIRVMRSWLLANEFNMLILSTDVRSYYSESSAREYRTTLNNLLLYQKPFLSKWDIELWFIGQPSVLPLILMNIHSKFQKSVSNPHKFPKMDVNKSSLRWRFNLLPQDFAFTVVITVLYVHDFHIFNSKLL